MSRIVLDRFLMTCGACPSQWDGITDDGRAVYVRYRFGRLTVELGKPGDFFEFAAVGGERVLDLNHGDRYDGCMDEGEMVDLLREHIPEHIVDTLAVHHDAPVEVQRAESWITGRRG